MKKGKELYLGILALMVIVVTAVSFSYSIFMDRREEHGKLNIVAGTLDYEIKGNEIIENQITIPGDTTKEIKLIITSLNTIDSKYELYYIKNDNVEVGYMESETNTKGVIGPSNSKEVTIYIRNSTSISQVVTLGVEGGFIKNELVLTKGIPISKVEYDIYKEDLLNGADPVLADNLVPVIIEDDGTVRKTDLYSEWYNYSEKRWANSVILKDENISYEDGEVIDEDSIESYFVWIPKYSYQLWDLGNYTGYTEIDDEKPHAIPIRFGLTDTSDSIAGECTTPMNEDRTQGLAGESGNCKVGDYMTHPAFLAFDTTGIWVGKFETGYKGATSTSSAEINSSDSSKIIIKPNVYSWRNLTVGNMFQASYNYKRVLDSHMMKNTEWGAVAYLTNSNYGRCENGVCTEVRINNNKNYITGYASIEEGGYPAEGTGLKVDGKNTINYLNSQSNVASTTGNRSGIYDVVGGAADYVMGYTTGASVIGGDSGITSYHPDFFTNSSWDKYYDRYTSTTDKDYNNRILGDATGEMGPFEVGASSWHMTDPYFVDEVSQWFYRGATYSDLGLAHISYFNSYSGSYDSFSSFRVVLAPQK